MSFFMLTKQPPCCCFQALQQILSVLVRSNADAERWALAHSQRPSWGWGHGSVQACQDYHPLSLFLQFRGKKIPKVHFIGEEIEETVGRAKQEKSISGIHKGDKENYDETMTILKLFLCSHGFVHGYVIMFKPEKVSSKPCPQSWK